MVLICPWCNGRVRPGRLEKHKLARCPKAPWKGGADRGSSQKRRLIKKLTKTKRQKADHLRRQRIAAIRRLMEKGRIRSQWVPPARGLRGMALGGGLPS